MRACEACQTVTSEGELALSPAGQWLCRRCHATYESRVATRRQRSAEVARRCTCGNVVMPMRHPDEGDVPNLVVRVDGHTIVERDPQPPMFQSSFYVCERCGKEYRTHHPVMTLVLVLVLAGVIAATRRASSSEEGIIGLIAIVILGSCIGYEIYKWFRYPHVPE